MCYTCVRECPAKAIRIQDGQAKVINDRCIGCGNCVLVCSQEAKQVYTAIPETKAMLSAPGKTAACLAPSFPAAFPDFDYRALVGMLKKLGFDSVHEVSFGADVVAAEYRRIFAEEQDAHYIATTCPAIVNFVQSYYPSLVGNLAPVVSPMAATALALREMYGEDCRIVFIGPCIAKKKEAAGKDPRSAVDAVITFLELEEMFRQEEIGPEETEGEDFDEPHGNLGALFPVSRGMLQVADIKEDIIRGDVIAADGTASFVEAIKSFAAGEMDVQLLEILCCSGCIMGPGMPARRSRFNRRSAIGHFVQEREKNLDTVRWRRHMERFSGLNLGRTYTVSDKRIPIPSKEELQKILRGLGKNHPEDELNCGACGYATCVEHAVAIYNGMAETEMCLPYTIEQLRKTIGDLAVTNSKIAKMQETLLQTEKMASMGQLAAGIAHELNNPLGVVLMYSHLLKDELEGKTEISDDLVMIAEQAERCKTIVSGLLHFARQNKVVRQPVQIPELIEKSLDSVIIPEHVEVQVRHEAEGLVAELDKDQIIQVLTNLFSNACAAMVDGGTLSIHTAEDNDEVKIQVSDTGSGITEENVSKIFEPFFTTKGIGKGTGLGLAVSYGIIKLHSGNIDVQSNADRTKGPTGTTFTIRLPLKGVEAAVS